MYDFFNKTLATAKGKSFDSSFIYIDNAVRKNHVLIRDYILKSSLAVPPDHLIPKLLYSLGINYNAPDIDIIYNAKDCVRRVSNSLRLTSYTSFGQPLFNTFLDGGAEHIILTDDDFRLDTPWEKLTPVEFLYHTYTNVNNCLGAHRDDSGIGVIKINLPMLVYQYHKWRTWTRLNESSESIYHFTVKYPIFNSSASYMDISLFNRIYYRLSENVIQKDTPFGPQVPTANFIPQLDRSSGNILSYLTNKEMTIGQALYNIPIVFSENKTALDLTDNLDLYRTRQTEWFEMLYKLPYIHYGLLASNLSGGTLDQALMSKLKYEINAFIGARGLEMLPKQQSLHIIEKFIEPVMQLADRLQ